MKHAHPALLEHEFLFYPPEQRFRRVITRRAVRAIIRRQDELLLIHSPGVGDYKFPGGGVKFGEQPQQALQREVQEECGRQLDWIGAPLVRTIEKLPSLEAADSAFHLLSVYYPASVNQVQLPQCLDDYEAGLGFQPVWMRLADALQANLALIQSTGRSQPRWLQREIWVMQNLPATLG